MSRKKYSGQASKVQLYQEVKDNLEQIFNHLESAEISYNELEHNDYINLVIRPFSELLENIDVFQTNIDNDIYNVESDEEFDGNDD